MNNTIEEIWKEIEEKLPKFIKDMDVMLDKFGVKFKDQWK